MVLHRLIFQLLNNPHVIEKLSESRAIRRAAQITAFAVTKAQLTGKDAAQRVLRSNTARQIKQEVADAGRAGGLREAGEKLERIKDTFVRELREGIRDGKSHIKRGDGK